jgi:hypothetical protein
VRIGRGLGHVTALVVELGGHVVAVARAGAHDPPDRLVERGGRGRVAAAARTTAGSGPRSSGSTSARSSARSSSRARSSRRTG